MTSFTDFLDAHHIAYDVSGRNKNRIGWINFRCPNCGKDPYMGYNIAGRFINCWSCGPHSLAHVILLISGLPWNECKELAEGLPRDELPIIFKKTGKLTLPPCPLYELDNLNSFHSQYLLKRQFRPYYVKHTWNVKAIGIVGGHLKWRLFLPIYLRGEMVSWTTRKLNDQPTSPRYISAKDEQSVVSVDDLLYGIDYCRNSVILVEGPTDAWAIGPGAAAVMGVSLSPARLEQISRFSLRVICFDAEDAAQNRASKICRDLSVFPGTTHNIQLESGKDPASADKDEINLLRKEFLK